MAHAISAFQVREWPFKTLFLRLLSFCSLDATFGSVAKYDSILASITNLDDRFQLSVLQHTGRYKEGAANEYSNTREDRKRKISVLFAQSTADRNIGHCTTLLSEI